MTTEDTFSVLFFSCVFLNVRSIHSAQNELTISKKIAFEGIDAQILKVMLYGPQHWGEPFVRSMDGDVEDIQQMISRFGGVDE